MSLNLILQFSSVITLWQYDVLGFTEGIGQEHMTPTGKGFSPICSCLGSSARGIMVFKDLVEVARGHSKDLLES